MDIQDQTRILEGYNRTAKYPAKAVSIEISKTYPVGAIPDIHHDFTSLTSVTFELVEPMENGATYYKVPLIPVLFDERKAIEAAVRIFNK